MESPSQEYYDEQTSSGESDTGVSFEKKTQTKKRRRVPDNLPSGDTFVELLDSKIKDLKPVDLSNKDILEENDLQIELYCLYWNYHGDKKNRELVKKTARKVNNRKSASKSRKVKSDQLEELKEKVDALSKQNKEYEEAISKATLENDYLNSKIDELNRLLGSMRHNTTCNCQIGHDVSFSPTFQSQDIFDMVTLPTKKNYLQEKNFDFDYFYDKPYLEDDLFMYNSNSDDTSSWYNDESSDDTNEHLASPLHNTTKIKSKLLSFGFLLLFIVGSFVLTKSDSNSGFVNLSSYNYEVSYKGLIAVVAFIFLFINGTTVKGLQKVFSKFC